jgi:hypothetical protein
VGAQSRHDLVDLELLDEVLGPTARRVPSAHARKAATIRSLALDPSGRIDRARLRATATA